jgi:hypothetical protein
MKYSKGLAFSTIALAILTTGCVKKPENGGQVVYDNSQAQGTYTTAQTQGTYESSQPGTVYTTADSITYDNTAITPSGSIYTGEATDNTVITTTDAYGQPVASSANTSYGQPAVSTNGAYNDPYASPENFPDPYASSSSVNDSYGSAPISSNSGSTGGNRGGIQLQIAALGDYYAAEEFKNSLSLDPKYSAYVKRGNPNKVIVTGISSVSEANRLKETRFPGAFIVSGGSSYSAPSSYGSDTGYTTNTSYGSSAATNGIGVQIGAFSSYSKAQSAAESASSKYSPFVKTVTKNGKKLYKAILTGFASESEARSFIANRGSGFVVHGL